MKLSKNNILDTMIFALLVFNLINIKFNFYPLSSYAWSLILIILISSVYLYNHSKVTIYFGSTAIVSLSILSLVMISAAINVVGGNNIGVEVVFKFLALSLHFLFFVYFVKIYYRDRVDQIFYYIGMVGFLNSLFIVGMFFVPEFKIFWNGLIHSSIESFGIEIDLAEDFMSLRMIGINGFSAYATAFQQSVFLVFYLLYARFRKSKMNLYDVAIITLMVISAVIAARTFFVLAPFLVILYAYLFGFLKFIKLIIFAVVIGASAVWYLGSLDSRLYDFFIRWLLEPISDGFNTGSVSANIAMFSHLDFNDFSILGDLILNEGDGYYKGVDVGYFRLLYAIGYAGMALLFAIIIFPILSWRKDIISPTRISYIVIVGMIFIVMIKGLIVLDWYPIFGLLYVLHYADGVLRQNKSMQIER